MVRNVKTDHLVIIPKKIAIDSQSKAEPHCFLPSLLSSHCGAKIDMDLLVNIIRLITEGPIIHLNILPPINVCSQENTKKSLSTRTLSLLILFRDFGDFFSVGLGVEDPGCRHGISIAPSVPSGDEAVGGSPSDGFVGWDN